MAKYSPHASERQSDFANNAQKDFRLSSDLEDKLRHLGNSLQDRLEDLSQLIFDIYEAMDPVGSLINDHAWQSSHWTDPVYLDSMLHSWYAIRLVCSANC